MEEGEVKCIAHSFPRKSYQLDNYLIIVVFDWNYKATTSLTVNTIKISFSNDQKMRTILMPADASQ